MNWTCRCESCGCDLVCSSVYFSALSEISLFCLPLSLNIRNTDVLTVFDGRDVTSHVIGQYLGPRERFQVVSGGSEVTIQFQSDPDDSSFLLSQGFHIHYHGESNPLYVQCQ